MRQGQCGLCGRHFMLDDTGAGTCPSCGFAIAPAASTGVAAAAPAFSSPPTPASEPPAGAGAIQPHAESTSEAVLPLAPPVEAEPAIQRADQARPPALASEPPPPVQSGSAPAANVAMPPAPSMPEPVLSPAAPTPVAPAPVAPAAPPLAAPQPPAYYVPAPSGYVPPGPPPYPYSMPAAPPYPMPVPPAPGRRGPSPWLVALIIAVVVVLLACAVLAALLVVRAVPPTSHVAPTPTTVPTATPTAGPVLPAGFTAYKDAGGLFTLGYPTGWSKFDGAAGGSAATPAITGSGFGLVLFSDSTTQAAFGIEYIQVTYPGGPTAFDDGVFKSFAQDGTLTHKQGPTTTTFGGQLWTQESADVTAASVGAERMVVDAASHGDYTVGIFYSAPTASFTALSGGTFEPMLSTFAFLK